MAPTEPSAPDIGTDDLRFLLSLYETPSLTTSASHLQLSMGAASRRLGRLRAAFGDELFVRSALLLMPTERMRALVPEIRRILLSVRELFTNDTLDLGTSQRTVRILSMDNGILTLLNDAIGHFYRSAPHATIRVESVDRELFSKLREGDADMALFPVNDVPKDMRVLELYRTRRGILVRDGHPLLEIYAERGHLTLEDLAQFRKIDISFSGAPRWGTAPRIEAELTAGVQRTGFSMPYFLAVPYVVGQTDFTYTAPVITLQHFVRMPQFNLRMLPAPAELAEFVPRLIWHERTHTDPFLQWVRAIITDNCREAARQAGALL